MKQVFIGIRNEENCSLSHWTHEELLAAAIPHHVELGYIAVQSPRLLPKSCGRQDGQGDLLPTSLLHVAMDQVNALVYRSLGHGHYLVGAIAARFYQAKFCQQLECLYEFNDYFFRNTMEVFSTFWLRDSCSVCLTTAFLGVIRAGQKIRDALFMFYT